EIGLMTEGEFLRFRNPDEKTHSSDSYDTDLFRLNYEHPWLVATLGSYGSDGVRVEELSGGYRLVHQDKIVAVIHNGTAYYDNPQWRRRIPSVVTDSRGKRSDFQITSFKQVKYLSEVVSLISPIAKRNEAHFPVILQRLLIQGEPLTVRAEKQPALD